MMEFLHHFVVSIQNCNV